MKNQSILDAVFAALSTVTTAFADPKKFIKMVKEELLKSNPHSSAPRRPDQFTVTTVNRTRSLPAPLPEPPAPRNSRGTLGLSRMRNPQRPRDTPMTEDNPDASEI